MPVNSEELLQTIKQQVNLVELIAETVRLHQSGITYTGLCPFPHGYRSGHPVYDTKPSLVVYPVNNTYYCYGCGAGNKDAVHGGGSDAIGWIQNLYGVDFKDALRILAERLGIDYDSHTPTANHLVAWEQTDMKNRLYRETLLSNKSALAYVHGRGVTEQAILHGRLGLVPPAGDYPAAGRLAIGICAPPLKDGRVLTAGHAYRALDDSMPKYLLDRTSPSFSRRHCLYLFSQNSDAIRSSRCAILTEGYFDALLLWSAGARNSCAIMGTAVTQEQIGLLKGCASKVVLWMDGDTAGKITLLKVVPLLYKARLQVDIIECTGIDPDEFVRVFTGSLPDFIAQEARPAWEWLLVYAFRERLNSSFESWGRLRSQLQAVFDSIPDTSLSSSVLREFAKIDA